jgi:hypothetical protein
MHDHEPTPSETVHVAIDDLLMVVAKASEDLRTFHSAVSRARLAPLPPFPRATVALTLRIVHNLKGLEDDLRQVLVALGLPEPPPA